MSDKRLWLNRLFDFYGPLLTEKQREVFSLYYEDDSTLEEIAEEKGGSRQSVFDLLRRTESTMLKYEKQLRLQEKYKKQTELIEELQQQIISVPGKNSAEVQSIEKIFSEFNDKFENSYFESSGEEDAC